MTQKRINKVIKGLKKASATHAKQAKTLEAIKLKKGGSAGDVPKNVANPSLIARPKLKPKPNLTYIRPLMQMVGWYKNTSEWVANTKALLAVK